MRLDEATEDSLERFTGEKEFLPLTFESLLGDCPVGMSIPVSFVEDIVGIECLVLRSVFEELVFVKEKKDLFAKFPIGAIMQDGGKKKEAMDVM